MMDKPPPYEPSDEKLRLSTTEKHSQSYPTPPTTFNIRQTSVIDAAGMARVNEYIQNTLRSTLDSAQDISTIKSGILTTPVPDIIQLVAVATRQPPSNLSSNGISGLMRKLASHTIERTSDTKASDILGFVHLIPFLVGGSTLIKRTPFNRTASIILSTLGESELGFDMWHAVNVGLVEEVCARCRDEGHRYKTFVTTIVFHNDEPDLVALRDMFLDCGFVEAGCLKEVIDKHGKLLDRLTLQKML